MESRAVTDHPLSSTQPQQGPANGQGQPGGDPMNASLIDLGTPAPAPANPNPPPIAFHGPPPSTFSYGGAQPAPAQGGPPMSATPQQVPPVQGVTPQPLINVNPPAPNFRPSSQPPPTAHAPAAGQPPRQLPPGPNFAPQQQQQQQQQGHPPQQLVAGAPAGAPAPGLPPNAMARPGPNFATAQPARPGPNFGPQPGVPNHGMAQAQGATAVPNFAAARAQPPAGTSTPVAGGQPSPQAQPGRGPNSPNTPNFARPSFGGHRASASVSPASAPNPNMVQRHSIAGGGVGGGGGSVPSGASGGGALPPASGFFGGQASPSPAPVGVPPGRPAPSPTRPPAAATTPRQNKVVIPMEQFLQEQTDSGKLPRRFAPSDVPPDGNGLKVLASHRAWKTAKLVCDLCLGKQQKPHEMLQYHLCRIICSMKLKQWKDAESAFVVIGDISPTNSLYHYENYPDLYPGKIGSMVPFALRIIEAKLPFFLGDAPLALDRLYALYCECDDKVESLPKVPKLSQKEETDVTSNDMQNAIEGLAVPTKAKLEQDEAHSWTERWRKVVFTIVNIHTTRKEFDLAITLLERALECQPNDVGILSQIGNIHLQIGDVDAAEEIFDRAECFCPNAEKAHKMKRNRGLLLLSKGEYQGALQEFQQILTENPSDVQAANNMSICYLYMCQLPRAIHVLETMIRLDPTKNLEASTVFNLCMLYDLDAVHSVEKKKAIEELVRKCGPDDFDVSIFKPPS